MRYLDAFRRRLEQKWKGSLVSTSEARETDPNAKKYLSQLVRQGQIEKVVWGWYWVPADCDGFFEFLAKDRHFKVLHKQTAAAYWSGDFIHRDQFAVAVQDSSYGRALEKFAASQGWKVRVEARTFARAEYRAVGGLYVEALEETIADCVKEWAFMDAFASLHQNCKTIDWSRISQHYWERIPRSNTRVGQVVKYGASIIGREAGSNSYSQTRARIDDDFVRRQVEEAAERVVELVQTA